MSLKVGIVGLPNVGKSTLFSALTKNEVDINNYPFCTIKPNVGISPVADERLNQLHTLFPESKKINAIVEFVDIAGLVKNAHKGEGLGNQFLSNVRNVDVVLEVVRVFRNVDIEHVEKSVDPQRDIGTIRSELILADLELIRRRKDKLAKEKRGLGPEKEAAEIEWAILDIFENKLNQEEWLCPLPELSDKLIPYVGNLIKNFSLLTTKPILYVLNGTCSEEEARKLQLSKDNYVVVDAKLEKEMNEISLEEQDELGLKSQLDDLVRHSYALLGLLTFFTSGDKETRAWEVKKGALAPQAAGVIHSDFEKNFISANVISWQKLLEAGSWKKARETGHIRREGKEYRMQEGDTVEFLVGK
jgi:ribosome-binding ATPase